MTLSDPAQLPLRDIHLPAAISAWPPAPGWWLLAACGIGLPLGLWLVRGWRARQRLRREALREFAALAAAATSPHAFATGLDLLLRRVALAMETTTVPGAGEAWMAQLKRIAPSLELDGELRLVLLQAPYDPAATFDLPRVRARVEEALRRLPRRKLAARHV